MIGLDKNVLVGLVQDYPCMPDPILLRYDE